MGTVDFITMHASDLIFTMSLITLSIDEVSKKSIPTSVLVTHTSLFDGGIEGIKHKTKKVFSVQYHPESSPGPHDSHYLFKEFIEMIKRKK